MEDCIFCKIIKKQIPAEIVYENERVVAFKDISPAAPIHILIVPKKHIESVKDIDKSNSEYIEEIHFAVNMIAKSLGISESGFRLISNCGPDAGQSVMHLHYHLIGGKSLGLKIL